MKHDLYPVILKQLKNLYNLSRRSENYIFKYVYIRAAIYYDKRKVSNRELFDFIIYELNLSEFEDDSFSSRHLVYKDEKYYLFELSSDFIDNFTFRAEMEGSISVKDELSEIFAKGSQKASKHRKSTVYQDHKGYNRLMILNEIYNVKDVQSTTISGFKYSFNHNPMERSLEEKMESVVISSKHEITKNVSYVREERLEDYLVQNLELIEEGLVFIRRQVEIPGGIIDILAKDRDGNICILELKTVEDKSIVWQSIHYPKEIANYYRSNIRMITVVPEYSLPIKNALNAVDGVEMISYEIESMNGRVVSFKVK